jgi:acetyltransferase-like isoleucine patch superfamily enzyme
VTRPLDPSSFVPPTGREILAGLVREAVNGAGYTLLRILTDWIIFPDGPLVAKLRGRVFRWLFGWGKGVAVRRNVVFRNVRSIRVGAYAQIMTSAVLDGPISIGERSIVSEGALLYPGTSIGDHCYVGERSVLYHQTAIGHRVSLGPLVYVITRWHEMGPPTRRTGPVLQKPVRIGEGAIVNGCSIVLPGCDIGNGAVVAGGAKVTRRVPPNVVVAGNPAVVMHRLEGGR